MIPLKDALVKLVEPSNVAPVRSAPPNVECCNFIPFMIAFKKLASLKSEYCEVTSLIMAPVMNVDSLEIGHQPSCFRGR